ncbi:hypothetical protein OS493_022483 [Desmophyllum pertusum]|uniref:Uncharacterized protein n=1 Tax=Desmophyllum pertusum TaxID=174260 RepID=A0A9W9ZN45_9CNID|nr:hypothetical protein OS493_022483 [Desmophyllum pertusum]
MASSMDGSTGGSTAIINASRSRQRNSFLSCALPLVRISECNKTITEARLALEEKMSRSISAAKVESYSSLLCLLDELPTRPCLPFHAAFEEYASKDGLPVIIISAGNENYVLLIEKPIDNISLCKGINSLLEESTVETTRVEKESLLFLAALFPMLKKLLSSAIDRAVVYCILSLLLSSSNMNMLFGINESFSSRIKSEIIQLAQQVEKKEEAEQVAGKHIEDLITKLSSEIENESEVIERKRKRCDIEEMNDLEFDVANKCQRLNKLQTDFKQQKKGAKRRTYLVWRSSLRRQRGKNKNLVKIDRGAATAVYNVPVMNS